MKTDYTLVRDVKTDRGGKNYPYFSPTDISTLTQCPLVRRHRYALRATSYHSAVGSNHYVHWHELHYDDKMSVFSETWKGGLTIIDSC